MHPISEFCRGKVVTMSSSERVNDVSLCVGLDSLGEGTYKSSVNDVRLCVGLDSLEGLCTSHVLMMLDCV